jgi:hypothetical protein
MKNDKALSIVLIVQVMAVYIINTIIITLFLFTTDIVQQQIMMALNLVVTTAITYILWKYIILKKSQYSIRLLYAMMVVTLVAATFKYIVNAINGDISIVYALLILLGFIISLED